MLKVEKLTKRYGKRTVVDSLDFTGNKGEILGLLGPNGAGKSTTMNMLTGYIAPSSGSIILDDKDLTLPKNRKKVLIGYMPEIPPLYNDMTVAEFMKFDAELKGVKRDCRKDAVSETIERCGIADVEKRLIKNLSKGYRQRVGFASAIIGDPELIILDEPTAGLDPRQIVNMREMILSLKKDHLVILSSHILSEVEEVCDHVLIISKGRLVLSDNTEHLLEEHDESLEDVFLELTDGDEEATVTDEGQASRYEDEEDIIDEDNIEELEKDVTELDHASTDTDGQEGEGKDR
ncbi:ABC transporter ATP-binding protein [Candidatus Weimeria sp. HCP3S3_B5]|uniref:ABC transporter ATP-binding protein n=1 Tax=Candidatus Weimeria sp. HCP3S3_B5 TaxID=3438871 RepID=UPI003F88EBA1